ncbi:UNKNOWN [Stylonychia lemnae]|uniref:Uncharacterized protein n=1 Tax=Stylonychia lemnae TaxID=5949 RepID=A0A077ZQ84_STYLE|nr:UNKNOWN [Stylonychia lemnae]|eukprot:CDW71619.1 UNKNOWN [Stylonychia lemnae]
MLSLDVHDAPKLQQQMFLMFNAVNALMVYTCYKMQLIKITIQRIFLFVFQTANKRILHIQTIQRLDNVHGVVSTVNFAILFMDVKFALVSSKIRAGYDENCLIYDYIDKYNCLKCKQGYYIQKNFFFNETSNRGWDGCVPKCENNGNYYQDTIRCKLKYEPASQQVIMTQSIGCRDGCYECVSNTECISCKKGYYLLSSSRSKTSGQCLEKSGTFTGEIYVRGANQYRANVEKIGSIQNPFYSIKDALTKAYEMGAPFSTARIRILLYQTDIHAIISNYTIDQYMPYAYDQNSQSTQIIIEPQFGQPITVLYKMRGTFRFLVGGGLTIRNIIFDAIDSVIDPQVDQNTDNCLMNPNENCCRLIFNNNQQNYSLNGASFIQFDLSSQSMLNQPPTLYLELKQKQQEFPIDFKPYDNSCSNLQNSENSCYSINITGCEYSNYGSLMKKSDKVIGVNSQYGMQYTGLMLDLDNFNGNVSIASSTFMYNNISYQSCDSAFDISKNKIGTDNYPSLGSKDKIQIKSVISIVNHGNYKIDIIGNRFQQNTATKGVIYLDLQNRTNQNRLLIENNEFNYNFGFIEASAVYLRVRGGQQVNVIDSFPDQFYPYCSGYAIIANTFNQNIGCTTIPFGLLKFECVNFQQTEISANGQLLLPNITNQTIKDGFYNVELSQLDSLMNLNQQQSLITVTNFDNTQLSFQQNQYIKNAFSGGYSLINIFNAPRIIFQQEKFLENGETFREQTRMINLRSQNATNVINSVQEPLYNTIILTSFDQSLLGQSLISIKRSLQVILENVVFQSNFMIESTYSTERAQLITLRDFYGQFKAKRFLIQNHQSPVKACSVYSDSYFLQYGVNVSSNNCYYLPASPHPLFRFALDYKLKFTNEHMLTDNSIVSSEYIKHDSNSDSYFLTNNIVLANWLLQQSQLNLSNLFISGFNCYNCTLPIFDFKNNTFNVINTTLKSMRLTFYQLPGLSYQGLSLSFAPIFSVQLRKPFIQNGLQISQKFITQNLTVNDNLGKSSTSRLFTFTYLPASGQLTPNETQFILNSSTFTNIFTEGNGALASFNVDNMMAEINNCYLQNLNSGYLFSQIQYYTFGGSIYVASLQSIKIENTRIINSKNRQSTATDGGGSFFYVKQSAPFTYIQKNTLIIGTDFLYDQNTLMSYTASRYFSQGSCIHIDTGVYQLNIQVSDSEISQCVLTNKGGAILAESTSQIKNIILINNQYQKNSAISGGSIYCYRCNLTLLNNTFVQNTAFQGGDAFIQEPLQDILFDGFFSSSPYSYDKGGSIYYIDNTKTNIKLQITSTQVKPSNFSGCLSYTYGCYIYIDAYWNLNFMIQNTIFLAHSVSSYYNALHINEDLQGNLDFQINKCTFRNLNFYYGKAAILGYQSVYQNSFANFSIIDSELTSISASQAGLIYYQGLNDVSIKIVNTNLTYVYSQNYGGVLYIKAKNIFTSFEQQNYFQGLNQSYGAGIAYLEASQNNNLLLNKLSVNQTFQQSQYSLIYLKGLKNNVQIINNTEIKNIKSSNFGGFLQLYGNDNFLNISQVTFFNNYGSYNGPIFHITGLNYTEITLAQNSSFIKSYHQEYGGFMYLDVKTLIINMRDILLEDISTQREGGIFYLTERAILFNLTVDNITVNGSRSAGNGSFLCVKSTNNYFVNNPILNILIKNSYFSIKFQNVYETNQTFTTFYRQISYASDSGQLFYFGPTSKGAVLSINNTFTKLYYTGNGAVFYLPSQVSLIDQFSKISQSSPILGQIYCQACKMILNGTKFIDNFAYSTSLFYFGDSCDVQLINLDLSLGKAVTGTSIFIGGKGAMKFTLSNFDRPISYFESSSSAAFIQAINQNLEIIFENMTFQHFSAYYYGGLIQAQSIKSITLRNVSVFNCTAFSGSVIYSTYNLKPTFIIESSRFVCDSQFNYNEVKANMEQKELRKYGGAFYIQYAQSVNSSNNIFENCTNILYSAVFDLIGTQLNDINSTYRNLQGYSGGVIYGYNLEINLENPKLYQIMSKYGGSLYLLGASTLKIKNLQVNSTYSYYQGGFLYYVTNVAIPGKSIEIIGNTSIYNSVAKGEGGAFYLQFVDTGSVIFDGILKADIINSQSMGGFLFLSGNADITINNAVITRTWAAQGSAIFVNSGHYLSSNRKRVNLSNSYISCYNTPYQANDISMLYQKTTSTTQDGSFDQGGAIYIIDASINFNQNSIQNCYVVNDGGGIKLKNSNFIDNGSNFQNLAAQYGAAIYCQDCTAYFNKSNFSNIYAKNGGLMYAQYSYNVTFDNITVDNSSALGYGGLIYALQNEKYDIQQSFVDVNRFQSNIVFINGITFNKIWSEKGGGGLFLFNKNLNVLLSPGCKVFNSAVSNGQGGFINIQKAAKLTIEASTFINFTSNLEGSLIYSIWSGLQLVMKNNTFTRNEIASIISYDETISKAFILTQGGSIYVKNAQYEVISYNNLYSNNLYSSNGGALYIENSSLNDSQSRYLNNFALNGGGIACVNCSLKLNALIFEINSAQYLGGSMYIKNLVGDLNLQDLQISDGFSFAGGSGISLENDEKYFQTEIFELNINDVVIHDMRGYQGGFLYAKNNSHNIFIENFTAFDIQTTFGGGIFYLENINNLTLKDGEFQNYHTAGLQGSLLYASHVENGIFFDNCSLKCSSYYDSGMQNIISQYESFAIDQTENENSTDFQKYYEQTSFFIENVQRAEFLMINISQCYICNKSGAYIIRYASLFKDFNSNYRDLFGLQGGIYSFKNVEVDIQNIKIENLRTEQGGIIYLNDTCPILMKNISAQYLYAYKKAGFLIASQEFLEEQSLFQGPRSSFKISIENSTFKDIYSRDQGGLLYISSDNLQAILMKETSIQNVTSLNQGGIFYVQKFKGELAVESLNNETTLIQSLSSIQGSLLFSEYNGFSFKIKNIEVQCQQKMNKTFEEFLSDSSLGSNVIYMVNSVEGLTVENSIFRNCYSKQKGGVFYMEQTKLQSKNSIFLDNAAESGGCFYCKSCQMYFENVTTSFNQAKYGGVLSIDNDANITLLNAIMNNNFALNDGGVINMARTNLTNTNKAIVTINDSQAIRNNIAKNGGYLYIDNINAEIRIFRIKVYNISANSDGGFIRIINGMKVDIRDSQFKQFKAEVGSFMISESLLITLNYLNNYFLCDENYDYFSQKQNLQNGNYNAIYGSVFHVTNAKSINSQSNNYQQCGQTKLGGVFYLSKTQLNDSKSSYSFISSLSGGIIYAQESMIRIFQSDFQQNLANQAGIFQISQRSGLYIDKSVFQYNFANYTSGILHLSTQSYMIVKNSDFSFNYADENSVFDINDSNLDQNITIISCQFVSNNATKNTFSLMYSKVIIQDSVFKDNLAYQRTKNIFCGFSKITVKGCTFSSPRILNVLDYSQSEKTQGAFFFIIFDVSLSIQDSQFSNGMAQLGGAIYLTGDSDLKIYSSTFTNNYAFQKGGAIFAQSFSNLFIGQQSQFSNNLAIEVGDDVYVTNSEETLSLSNVKISNEYAKTSIYSEKAEVKLSNVIFQNIGLHNQSQKGAALQCKDCKGIEIISSQFLNLKSKLGGAIYIEESESNKHQITSLKTKYFVQNSVFQQCEALIGGAIYLNNPQDINFQSSKFNQNKAYFINEYQDMYNLMGSGGAIYYTCQADSLNCKMTLSGTNSIINNVADIQGGGIYWDQLEPQFKQSAIKFGYNIGRQYGNDIACFSQQLKQIDKERYDQQMILLGLMFKDDIQQRILQNLQGENLLGSQEALIENQRSGGSIPKMIMAHLDKYGQIVGSDFKSKVRVSVNATFNQDSNSNKFPPIIEGQSSFDTIGGIVLIKDIIIAGTPGYDYQVVIYSDGIDENKKSNQEYKNKSSSQSLESKMQVSLRECELGEVYTASGKCQLCEGGYSLKKMTDPGLCMSCPNDKAICNGGSDIGPLPGFWRKNNLTSTFIKCMHYSACLGMIPPINDPMGSCSIGYQGVLCADCQIGYSRQNQYACQLSFCCFGIWFILIKFVKKIKGYCICFKTSTAKIQTVSQEQNKIQRQNAGLHSTCILVMQLLYQVQFSGDWVFHSLLQYF